MDPSHLRTAFLALATATATAACTTPGGSPPTTLFHGGRIHLGDGAGTVVEALLVRDGVVLAAGGEAELRRSIDVGRWREVDLGGGTAVPGLQDAHGHWEGLGAALEDVDLRGAESYEEVVRRVAEQARRQPPGTWVQGRGWDQNLWPGRAFPEHGPLSAAVPEHPVLVRRIDGHAALVNRSALEAAGLGGDLRGRARMPGGEILLEGSGRASGVLVDTAMGLVSSHVPPPSRATRRRRILLAQDALLALGLTAVHDMGVDPEGLSIFAELRDEGRLVLREIAYLDGARSIDGARGDRLARPGVRQGKLAVAGVKLYADGALGSRGAALLADYADRPGERGLLRVEPEQLLAELRACAAGGLQPAVHAIGDRANRVVLDAFEALLAEDPGFARLRPRVEHAQVVDPSDWPRFAALGAVPSVQPTHATSDMPWAPDRLGRERLVGAYAWRRLAPDPTRLALGSDFPVELADPLRGLYAARTRQDPEGRPAGGWLPDQRLTAAEALAGFTAGAAWAAHQEDRRGRLTPGCCADLTVLDVDPLACEPRELLSARVLMTVVDGEMAFPRADP